MNLNKANKILSKLKAKIAELEINPTENINVDVVNDAKEIVENIKKRKNEALKNLNLYLILNEDFNKLKETIFEENLKTGIHTIISELNFKRKMNSFKKNQIMYLKNENLDSTDIPAISLYIQNKIDISVQQGVSNFRLVLNNLNKEDLVSEIKKTEKEIEILEEQLMELNVSSKIDFVFQKETIEAINL